MDIGFNKQKLIEFILKKIPDFNSLIEDINTIKEDINEINNDISDIEQNTNLYNGKFLDFNNSEVISPSGTTPNGGSSQIKVPKDGFCFMYHQIGHNGTGDLRILINNVEVASDYASGSYQRVNISMPLKKDTVITFKNDSNVHSYTKLVVVPFLE